MRGGEGWVELGPRARETLASALLGSDAVRALLAAAIEAAGGDDGAPEVTVELELLAARARFGGASR